MMLMMLLPRLALRFVAAWARPMRLASTAVSGVVGSAVVTVGAVIGAVVGAVVIVYPRMSRQLIGA